MIWQVRVSRRILIDGPETIPEAIGAAKRAQHGEGWDARIEELGNDRDQELPELFPEYSRQMLEQLYQDSSASLRAAAISIHGKDEPAVQAQIAAWFNAGAELSKKASVIRRLRNVKGTKQ